MVWSLSGMESGRGSETAWRRGPAVDPRGRFGIPPTSALDRHRLRETEMFVELWGIGLEHGF